MSTCRRSFFDAGSLPDACNGWNRFTAPPATRHTQARKPNIIIAMPGCAEPATTPSASTVMATRLETRASAPPQTITTHISREVRNANGSTSEARASSVMTPNSTVTAKSA